jgi:MraZ protein
MLRGEAQYALDGKGRVVIPPKFRTELGDRIVVTRWIDPCLAAFSPSGWQAVEEKLRSQPLVYHDFVRLIFSAAEDCDLDRQGRIMLPTHLRQHAGITRDVTIVGVGSRLEIWNTQHWRRQLQELRKNKDRLAEQIQALILS